MRVVTIHPRALEHLGHWADNDLKILKRIVELLEDIQRSPFTGSVNRAIKKRVERLLEQENK